MKISINQLRLELADILEGHLQMNTFFWGDFPRAVNEENINYPLMASYYPSAGLLDNQTSLPITIVIADKIYEDYTNLNDVESDTLQYCRDVFNIMNKSTRWQKLGRVESCSLTKFIEGNADVCAGHIMTVNFTLRDSNSICDLPMSGYDFDQVIGASCLPVQIYRNGILVDTVESGGTYSYTTDAFTYTIKNTALTTLYSGDVTANLNVTIQNSTAVLKDTALNVISTTSIQAEGSEDIIAPDVVINFQYEDGSPIDTVNFLSGTTNDVPLGNSLVSNSDNTYQDSIPFAGSLVLPDITVDVTNSALTVVNTSTVASVQDVTISAPDGTINIKKTGDGTISSQSVPSGATANYSVADNAITVNSANGFSIDATDPLDIVLKDSNGSTLTPNSVTPNQGQHKVDIVLPVASSIDTDAKSFLTASGITDTTITNAIDTLVTGLKSNGLWNKFYAIYPFVGGTAFTHKWNLKDSRDLDAAFRLTFYGGLTHNSNGVTGNGLTGYADTYFNPVAQAINRENFGFSIYSRSASWGGYAMGVTDGASFSLLLRSGTTQYYGLFDDGSAFGTVASGNKTLTTQRSSNTLQTLYRDGSSILSINTITTRANVNYPITLFCRNGVGGIQNYSTINSALNCIHAILTPAEVATFNTLVVNFQTALSRNV